MNCQYVKVTLSREFGKKFKKKMKTVKKKTRFCINEDCNKNEKKMAEFGQKRPLSIYEKMYLNK